MQALGNFMGFEKAVMAELLMQSKEAAPGLMAQYENATITRQEYTGCGFFVDYQIPDKYRIDDLNVTLGASLIADIDGLCNGMGFALFVRNGLIAMLEGYTFDETWNGNIEKYSFRSA